MGIFYSNNSTGTGSFFTTSFNSAPKPKPYTGYYLPALIHVFDYEVDLEKATVADLEKKVSLIEQESNRLSNLGNRACISLEHLVPERIKKTTEMQRRLQHVQNLIRLEMKKKADLERQGETVLIPEHPEPLDETIVPQAHVSEEDNEADEQISEHLRRTRRLEARLDKEQNSYKKASAMVRALHRKVMLLTHENKHGVSAHLRELYDLANLARMENNESALRAILALARQFHSPQGKLAVINFLRSRKEVLVSHHQNLKATLNQLRQSPTLEIHARIERGDNQGALDLFESLLERNVEGIVQAIAQAEMQYSTFTGTFTDGSTTMQVNR